MSSLVPDAVPGVLFSCADEQQSTGNPSPPTGADGERAKEKLG
ncbi:hypothetical protein ACIGGF_09665 [Rhodococcus sp. NPDC078407]